jgi:hypothetical protein
MAVAVRQKFAASLILLGRYPTYRFSSRLGGQTCTKKGRPKKHGKNGKSVADGVD